MMFGYATNETEECMPLTISLAHNLNRKMAELRKTDPSCEWLRPDSKTQVTCEHELRNGEVIPTRVHTVVISVQHAEEITLEEQRAQLKSKVQKDIQSFFIENCLDYRRSHSRSSDRREHDLPSPALRSIRHWRSSRRCWSHRAKNHRRHLWRLGCPRWWRLLRQGLHQGRPLRRLRCPLGRQVPRHSRPRPTMSGPGLLCHWCFKTTLTPC